MNSTIFFLMAVCFSATTLFSQETEVTSMQQAHSFLSHKPVLFQENKGQITNVRGEQVSSVLFKTASSGVDTYITTQGLVYVFSKSVGKEKKSADRAKDRFKKPETSTVEAEWLQVHLEGATIRPENVVKERAGKTDYNFFLGHCPNGITVKEYEKITIKEVYSGIDWVLYGSSKTGMKYDFIVHPGADASQIRLIYEGEHPVTLDETGNIQVQLRWARLTEQAPVSFVGAEHTEVKSAFKSEVIDQHHVRVTYAIDPYAKEQELVIDPQLVWGTFFGGSNDADIMQDLTHDSNNNVFITGYTRSSTFPLLDAGTYYQPNIPGNTFKPFILKFSNSGVLLWSTLYSGNSGYSWNTTIVCDGNDNVFIAGSTDSQDLPVQDAGTYFQATMAGGNADLFILKFDNAGNRLWATYYGGSSTDVASAVTCDANNNLFILGITYSVNFPVQNSGTYFQSMAGGITDMFILKFDNAGNRMWGSYYGGSGEDIPSAVSCDANGNVFVTGATASANFPVQNAGTYFDGSLEGMQDIFLLKFDNAGNRLWATYYGGNDVGSAVEGDQPQDIAVDPAGNIFVTGATTSSNFPVQNAGGSTYFDGTLYLNPGDDKDQFMLKFDNAGTRLWATYYGGNSNESISAGSVGFPSAMKNMAIDKCGNVYVSFWTHSTDIQTLDCGNGSYYDGVHSANLLDGASFLTRFKNDGTLTWATYIDAFQYITNNLPILLDNNNNLFLIGSSGPFTWNLTVDPGNGAYSDTVSDTPYDGFILKFAPEPIVYTSSQTPAGCTCSGTAKVNVTGSTGPFTYTWSNGAQTANTTALSDSTSGLCAGSQWVEIRSCYTVDTVFFTFAPGTPPAITFTADDTTICAGSCVNFSTTIIPGANYTWSFGDLGASSQVNPFHCYAAPGSYDVTLTVIDQGCSATQTLPNYITVSPSPVAGISANPLVVFISNPVINFTEQASGETSWHWNFGDALPGQSDAQNPSYTYTGVGDYSVSLIVSNTFQCTDTAHVVVHIYDDLAFYAPNTFTPTGDVVNDVWLPIGAGIDPDHYELRIFNRWGELLWQTRDITEGWNGKLNGKPVPEGIYTWTARIVTMEQIPMLYNGTINLLR